jgi:hypothetical protein
MMNNQMHLAFQQLFETDLCLLQNPVCEQCDAQLRHPLMPWMVGKLFESSAERILFVGKPHRGTPGTLLASGIIDPTIDPNNGVQRYWKAHWPYWSYTREIAENLYGPQSADFVAFTNLVKCTNVNADDGESKSTDQTTHKMLECCVLKLGVIWKEVSLVKPYTVVFYTYQLHPEMLEDVPIALSGSMRQITSQNHSVQCRNKRLHWWERTCRTSWTDNFRLLVIGHPERMARREFVQLLTNWLRPKTRTQPILGDEA